MPSRPPKPPAGTQAPGRRLWRAILADYELHENELAVLREAVRVADLCEQLHTIVTAEGPLVDGKVHPAGVELRLQRVLLARLLVALRIPSDDADTPDATDGDELAPRRLQRRGLRGVYGGAA